MSLSPQTKDTPPLRQMMQRAGFSSFKALRQKANVSKTAIAHLRKGQIARLRVETLLALSQALQVPINELLNLPAQAAEPLPSTAPSLEEYQRLEQQLVEQRENLRQEFQQESLQILESLLLQLPTAAHAAQQNPQAPAVKLLPLLRPIDRLLESWGIEAIAPVGTELAFDPHLHQLMEGSADPGDRVRVRYTGYRQGEKLLYRAKVSRV
ncbi:MAG TPA: nucleotide exchange factor GrpE [Leptolyngbyaceae cyanobacterium M33_DOE_097]|uniref:Nucleotide exchange factor GrpE n=1 Tax=Oscillatoriales cyanobacterium SpSt-418 TaxID=2282169 RepID=A0A7C3KHY2_9CYAN|nr:nucleotide exchange factor GrpE [Leptolyngbyaceae cyanobacterium M33_DOE_097]